MIYRYKSFTPGGIVYFRFDPITPKEPAEILMKILEKGEVSISGKFTVIERGRLRQKIIYRKK